MISADLADSRRRGLRAARQGGLTQSATQATTLAATGPATTDHDRADDAGSGDPARGHRHDGGRFHAADASRPRRRSTRSTTRRIAASRRPASAGTSSSSTPIASSRPRSGTASPRAASTPISRYGLGTVRVGTSAGARETIRAARAARDVPRQHLRVARSGDPRARRDAQAARAARRIADAAGAAAADAIVRVDDIHLNFGGVKAIADVGFEVNRGEISSIIGPNGAGKSSMLNVISGFYRPSRGRIYFEGKDRTHLPAHARRAAGLRAHVPEHRAVQGDDHARQHHDRALAQDQRQFPHRRAVLGLRAEGGDRAPRARREDHRLPRDPGDPQDAGRASCPTACRSASSWRARSRWSPRCCCSTSRWRG